MNKNAKINNQISNIRLDDIKTDKYNEIKEKDEYQIESEREIRDSLPDKDSKVEEDDENKPLIINKKLINIFDNISETIGDNMDKNIEEIYDGYQNKRKNKKSIKENISKSCIYIMFFIVAALFVIINLMAIFTTKYILESLYEIFVKSIQYFLYKKSDLELYELTDFGNRFNSSYNFYSQYYHDISNNEVDFDLMMFWNFIGSLFFECFDFIVTNNAATMKNMI